MDEAQKIMGRVTQAFFIKGMKTGESRSPSDGFLSSVIGPWSVIVAAGLSATLLLPRTTVTREVTGCWISRIVVLPIPISPTRPTTSMGGTGNDELTAYSYQAGGEGKALDYLDGGAQPTGGSDNCLADEEDHLNDCEVITIVVDDLVPNTFIPGRHHHAL